MLIYYNIVAVLTILYLVLTAYLMNFGNPFITSQGWHVVILGTLILVIIFGMEVAKKKFPDDFFEFSDYNNCKRIYDDLKDYQSKIN